MGANTDHYIAELGLHFSPGDDIRRGRSEVVEELCVPGTRHPRIAVLATYADLLAGHPPGHTLASTADLNVTIVGPPPVAGFSVVARTVKAGRTLLVGETRFTADGATDPFALSVGTFMNVPDVAPERGEAVWGQGRRTSQPFAERVGARTLAPGVVELERRADLTNGHGGTFQGGLSCLLGELAVESLLDDGGAPWLVEHLDVRYLRGVRAGPARTSARVIGPRRADRAAVVVEIHDAGADHLASYVVATAARLTGG